MVETGARTWIIDRRFEPTALLETGLGVQTFLGRDLRDDATVVIKQTPAANVAPGAQLRLEHEAEVLRDIATAGIAPIVHVGREGSFLHVVMPFVPGETLRERISRCGALSVADALAVGRGLLRALDAAHAEGVLHRDVKPSNVVLGGGSPPERVTLVDFGLARTSHLEASLREVPVEMVRYVSPEQAGLIHAEVAERSDLYSAGIVLSECLAGRPPFLGETVGEVLRQHLTARPPELRALGRAVPRALDDVIRRLLEKDPRDRYQSAAAVLCDLDEIAAAVERGIEEPVVAVGAHDRRRTLTEPAFVGRDAELRAFEEHLARADDKAPGLLAVEGGSGAGKTWLLDRAALTARQRGAWVLRGAAAAQDTAERPMQLVEDLARQIVLAAREDPELAETFRVHVGDHASALAAVAPALAELLRTPPRASPGPEAHGEARTVAAFVAGIDALGASSRTVVVLLDDCQWMGALLARTLVEWCRARAAGSPATRVLLVAAYRNEELPTDSPLRQLEPTVRISLGPLAPEDVRRMAESMAGPLPPDAVALVQQLSEGNPFLAAAVVGGLVEGGALVDGAHGWALDRDAVIEAQSSRRAAAFLARRLDAVSAPALHLLSIGAVLGKSFELQLASELSGQSRSTAMAAVAEGRRRLLVWLDSRGSRCTFVHDRVRDALLERLEPAARRELHERAAASLERGDRSGVDLSFDLAHHLDEAGHPVRALPHALSAASSARAKYALDLAERYYRIAQRGAAHADAETRRRVAEELGDVLLMRGRYAAAGACFEEARALATEAPARAAIEGKIGELAFKRGDVRAAAEALERALPLLGHRVPRGFPRLAAATLWLVIVQLAHTLLPGRLVARRRLEDNQRDLLAARLFSRLAYSYWFLRGQMATFWAHLSGLNLAERYPPTRELAQACSEHAIGVTGLPPVFFRRGVRYAERGLAIRRALGDAWGRGQSLNFYGMLLYAFGRYEEALDKFREAVRVLRRTGDRWEAHVAGLHVALCHYRLGALRDAVAECRRVHQEGIEIGDRHATAMVLEVWSKATGGAVPAELVGAALRASEDDPLSRESLLQAAAVRSIGAGRPAEAAATLATAEEVARSARLENEYVSYIPLWLARAQRLRALQAAIETGVVPPEPLRAAARALRRGLRYARRHRGNLPMALRERALLRAMRGRGWTGARRDLDASLAEAERQGARFEATQTRLARGELGTLAGWPGAEEETARARRSLREMGAAFACTPTRALPRDDARAADPVTLSLADRFGSIVDQGRRIASALTPEDVHGAVVDAAAVLLRGDATALLVVEGGELRRLAHRGQPVEPSRILVDRALRDRRPIGSRDLVAEPLPDVHVFAHPCSALCAPIVVGGQAVACLYVRYPLVGDLRGEDDERIAGYLATLAGASLGKAEAFAEVQQLSRTLLASNAELDANLRRLRETQEQLVQAAKMAAVGTLLAGLSHELNNPLSVILGRARLTLDRMADDDPNRSAVAAIDRQARRAAGLVRNLLDFSYKRPLELEETRVDDLVQHVGELASSKAREKDVALDVRVTAPGCAVRISRAQIESALLNLVVNAIDASPRGASVRIEALPADREHRHGLEVLVRDQGHGIEPDALSRVFEPFFTTKAKGSGTGLGLSLARQFVEVQGGQLSIESRVGEGTIARVWLPVVEEATAHALH